MSTTDLKHLAEFPEPLYFIRVKSNPALYLHYKRETRQNYEYEIREGFTGAPAWKFIEGTNFLRLAARRDLELVACAEVMPPTTAQA